jgi:hypothetical protein
MMSKLTGSQLLSEIVRYDKYAQVLEWAQRKETWEETVYRVKDMHRQNFPHLTKEINFAFGMVEEKLVSPSMRSLQFGGDAINANPIKNYNCSFLQASSIRAFRETCYLLLCGTGVGFSVQKHHVAQLPLVQQPTNADKPRRFRIGDSIEGWSDAFDALVKSYLLGKCKLRFDGSDIRPQGSIIRSTGAEAPGPEKLMVALANVEKVLQGAVGRYLRTIEVYDIMCYIAECVRSGGIRRSAMICLFSLDDQEMIEAKSEEWYLTNPQRDMSNNSAVLVYGEVSEEQFKNLIRQMEANRTGEPGIYWTRDRELGTNPCQPAWAPVLTPEGLSTIGQIKEGDLIWSEQAWTKVLKKWSTGVKKVYAYKTAVSTFYGTENHRVVSNGVKVQAKDAKSIDYLPLPHEGDSLHKPHAIINVEFISEEEVFDITVDNEPHTYWSGGCNVSNCVEISLRNQGFCNLTSQNMARVKDQKHFMQMCEASAILGTLQAAYTDFPYLNEGWRKNAEEEALLGCSMTGICDNINTFYSLDLQQGAKHILEVNKTIAGRLGIRLAKRTTAIKPEGTNSLFLGGVAPGMHAQYDTFFIRRMTLDKHTNIYKYLIQTMPELVEDSIYNPDQAYLCIPVHADPYKSVMRHEKITDFLQRLKYLHDNWIKPGHVDGLNTHNVSSTVSVKDEDWETLADWMWVNRYSYSGIAVFPYDNGTFSQAIYETITEDKYREMTSHIRPIDLTQVQAAAKDTNLAAEPACAGGACTF